jgi:hypothetical protein
MSTRFGCPKFNFESSKFHEISNLKNIKFDKNHKFLDQICPSFDQMGYVSDFDFLIFKSCQVYFFEILRFWQEWFTNTGTMFLTLNISPFSLYKISFALCSRKKNPVHQTFSPSKMFPVAP